MSVESATVIYGHACMDLSLYGCRAFGELGGSAEFTEDRTVVERRPEQAAEDARSRPVKASIPLAVIPAQAGIQWFRQAIPGARE